MEQIGAHRRDCVRALGPQERLLRILQIRLDVQRQLLGRTALGHLVREEVDARDRIADGDAVGRVSSAHQVAQASHPAQRLRRGLRQGAPGSFERSSLARSQPDRDEEPRRERAMKGPLGALHRHLAKQRMCLVRERAQREKDEIGRRLATVRRARLRDRTAQHGVQRADPDAARPARGDPRREKPCVERGVQLRRFEERLADVRARDARGR